MDISVVIPLLNEQESLPELIAWIEKVMDENGYTYEVILIDDGSSDDSWQVVQELGNRNNCIKGIKFRRNHGKSAALFCGFHEAEGNVIITMDADLQDSPDEIPGLYGMIIEDNYDLVSGWKKRRYDPISKTIPSKFFNWTARKVTRIHLHDFNCGLKAYKKRVVKSIEVYGEMHRYIPVLAKWAGFRKIGEKVVEHRARKYGITKFGLERFVNGFLDLLSVMFISKFGKKPMHLFGTIGTLMFFFGFLAAVVLGAWKINMVIHHLTAIKVTESPYFYISLTLMILGSQAFVAGFLGELVSRNSSERNRYQIEEQINL